MAETGLALTGEETFAELTDRYLAEPLLYTVAWGRFALLLLLPFALPLVGLPMQASREVMAALLTAAWVFAGTSLLTRWPPRLAVRITRHGVRWRGRAVPWQRVQGAVLGKVPRRRTEPRRLDVQVDGGRPIPVTAELTMTSPIRSLRNLAELIDALSAAARVADADAADALQEA